MGQARGWTASGMLCGSSRRRLLSGRKRLVILLVLKPRRVLLLMLRLLPRGLLLWRESRVGVQEVRKTRIGHDVCIP